MITRSQYNRFKDGINKYLAQHNTPNSVSGYPAYAEYEVNWMKTSSIYEINVHIPKPNGGYEGLVNEFRLLMASHSIEMERLAVSDIGVIRFKFFVEVAR